MGAYAGAVRQGQTTVYFFVSVKQISNHTIQPESKLRRGTRERVLTEKAASLARSQRDEASPNVIEGLETMPRSILKNPGVAATPQRSQKVLKLTFRSPSPSPLSVRLGTIRPKGNKAAVQTSKKRPFSVSLTACFSASGMTCIIVTLRTLIKMWRWRWNKKWKKGRNKRWVSFVLIGE